MLISTGSQGEPLSALSRIAQRNHNFVHIEEGDTVVLARSLIPGNENAVYRVINGLTRLGRQRRAQGQRAGARLRARLRRRAALLLQHRPAAQRDAGARRDPPPARQRRAGPRAPASRPTRSCIAEDGVVVDLVDGRAKIVGKVDCGYVFVDGSSVGDITESSLKDRRILGEEGFISVIVVVDSVDRQGRRRARRSTPAASSRTTRSSTRSSRRSSDALDAAAREGVDDTYQLQQTIRRVVGRWVVEQAPPPPDDHPGRHRGLGSVPVRRRDRPGRPAR